LKIKNKGNWEYLDNTLPQNYINNIFPISLSKYFLFDGERIRNLGDNNRYGKKDIREAVATVLNLDNLANATKHLKKVRKMVRDEYSEDFHNNNHEDIIEEIENKEREIEKNNTRLQELEDSRDTYEEEINKISNKMKDFSEIKNKANEREQLENDIKREKIHLNKAYTSFTKIFNDKSSSFFAEKLFEEAINYLNKFELQDGIIEGIDGKVIDEILERGKCICGEKIKKGSETEKKLMDLKKYLPPQSYGIMVNSFIKDINVLKNKGINIKKQLEEEYEYYLNSQNIISEKENELLEIKDFLENHSLEAIKNTETKRDEYKKRFQKTFKDIGITSEIINQLERDLKELKNKKEQISTNNDKDKLTKKREEVVDELLDYFDSFYNDQEEKVRNHLQKLVGEIFEFVLHKNYKISFDEKYKFYVRDNTGEEVSMSEGEKQITSLSFITGIVNMAKDESLNERFSDKTNYNASEIYPVIMDSPFGALDNVHRKNIAKKVPELSDQTILFVSSSQWEGEVENEMKRKTGKEYMLEYNEEILHDGLGEYTKIVEENIYV
jgi:DNA sulfur modification protein DndD